MNYWLITTEFPPFHGGGISTYCRETTKMMIQNGHKVTVFVNDYSVSNTSVEFPFKNLKLIKFNPNQVAEGNALGPGARLSLEFSNAIEQEMKKEGVPDILETQDYAGIGYYTLQKKQLLYPFFKDLKVVITMHAPGFLYFEYNQVPLYKFPEFWIGEMEKASIRMADLVISPSQYLIDELILRMNLREKNPIRIFNPYQSESKKTSVPIYEENDLVFFGKLTPQKGVLEMFTYLKKMWDDGFSHAISVIGGGEHYFYPAQEDMSVFIKKKYKKYIDKGLIKFEGNLPPEKLKQRLKKAHIIITPSIVDNLPYAVLEAMDLGKTVLSSSNGGHTEILKNNESGFIFHHNKNNSFEDSLLLALNKSKKELNKIGKNAQLAIIKNTNFTRVYEQKISELNKLIYNNDNNNNFDFIEIIEKEKAEILTTGVKGLLSIVIPFYNMGDFIEETIISLLKTKYTNYEIIIINDGSDNDNCIKKLTEIENNYSVKVYNKENEGLSLTRNYGADKSNGEFLAFLDADDTIEPNYYPKAIEVLKHYENVSFVGCWAQYFGNSNSIWPTFNPEPPYLLTHNMINSSALIYKKNDFMAYGKNDPSMIYGMEDYDSVIGMVKNGARGVVFPELWWNYRIRKNSMAQSFTKDKELYLYRLISEKHKNFFALYGDKVSNLLNYNGSGISFNNPTWPVSGFNKSKLLNKKIVLMVKKNKYLRKAAKIIYRKLYNK